ncbi:MAG: formylglycine-generating enzyme family protein [Planctomycetota bacterium]
MAGLVALAVFAGLGCSGTGGSPSETLSDAAALHRARFLVMDLRDGRVEPRGSVGDLAAERYRTTHMVFVRIAAGREQLGSESDALGHQPDESLRSYDSQDILLAAFPCTRAQWQNLTGSDDAPWATLSADLQGSVEDQGIPAHNLSHERVTAVLTTFHATHSTAELRLPSDDEWEYACRKSAATRDWCFADSRLLADGTRAPPPVDTIAVHALVWETGDGSGPEPVGQRAASPSGLHDLHGGVWELTREGRLRGGSWRDCILQARCANRQVIAPDIVHPLVGFRLVLVP